MARYTRVLSLDGGGIRGIIPGQILVALEKKLQNAANDPSIRIADYFDLVAGTSTGGILAMCLLCPDKKQDLRPRYTAKQAVDIYVERGDEIFDLSLWQKIRSLGGMSDEKYSAAELEEALEDYFGDIELKQLLKPCLITAYDIKRRKSKFFRQHKANINKDDNFLVRDVARATSAAPTYFETARIKSFSNIKYPLIDGGVFANNPALCAYSEARNLNSRPTAKDMLIVSLGTGDSKRPYNYSEAKDWGKIGWVQPLIDIMMSGVSETVDYQLKQIFDSVDSANHYLRIQADIPHWCSSELDNASPENIRALKEVGEKSAELFDNKLNEIVTLLTNS